MAKFSLAKLEEMMLKCVAPVLSEVMVIRETVEKLEQKISTMESLQNSILAKSSAAQQENTGTSKPIILSQQTLQANTKPVNVKNPSAREVRANTRRQTKKPANPALRYNKLRMSMRLRRRSHRTLHLRRSQRQHPMPRPKAMAGEGATKLHEHLRPGN
ncbi:hypothetical protein O0L34_g2491 [Tuta absoluta]|nr:hypothetical protein O0L34_g2491 [Tuta absoluta]